MVALGQFAEAFWHIRGRIEVGDFHHHCDHARQAHGLAVFGRENPRHAIGMQVFDFRRDDHAATAAENFNVGPPGLFQQVDHVFEVFHMSALVGRNRNALDVFLDRRVDDIGDGAVMAQVNDLGARTLQNPAHDVDRRIVPVEQAGRGHKADRIFGCVCFGGSRFLRLVIGSPFSVVWHGVLPRTLAIKYSIRRAMTAAAQSWSIILYVNVNVNLTHC